MANTHIAVIVVLYKPSQEHIAHVCRLSQEWAGVVVDNSSIPTFSEAMLNKMAYVPMNENVGIAKAQNAGIRKCLENPDTEFVVFLDQDSQVDITYPQRIVEEFCRQKELFPALGILGPTAINKDNNEPYRSRLHKETYLSEYLIVRPKIISSGACISRDILEHVGLYEEELFIDLVDSEWCWRAGAKGFLCGISPLVTITHHIGRKVVRWWKFTDTVSAPERYYYLYRNYLWMMSRNYVPIKWKLTEGLKNLARIVYMPFVEKEWKKTWKFMWKGTMAGIKCF